MTKMTRNYNMSGARVMGYVHFVAEPLSELNPEQRVHVETLAPGVGSEYSSQETACHEDVDRSLRPAWVVKMLLVLLVCSFQTNAQFTFDIYVKYFKGKKIFHEEDSIYIFRYPNKIKVISYFGNGEDQFLKRIIDNMEKFENLEVLEISNCSIEINTWKFDKLKKMKAFHFSSGNLHVPNMENANIEFIMFDNSSVNMEHVNFEKMPRLKFLHFSDVKYITGNIYDCKRLEFLYMCESNINKIPHEIVKLQYLKKLYLRNNPIDVLPDYLSKLKNINYLNVAQTNIVDLPTSLYKIKKLKLILTGGCDADVSGIPYNHMVKILTSKPSGWDVTVSAQ